MCARTVGNCGGHLHGDVPRNLLQFSETNACEILPFSTREGDRGQVLSREAAAKGEKSTQDMYSGWANGMHSQGPCIHDLIRDQAAEVPNAIAVKCGRQSLTYAKLDSWCERLAQLLTALDISTGDRVAVCVPRSVEMVVALLGTLKAGAAYVPLDPGIDERRLRRIIHDAQPSAIITCTGGAEALRSQKRGGRHFDAYADVPIIYLNDEAWDEIGYKDVRGPRSCAAPNDIACVLYGEDPATHLTGVQIPHRALTSLGRYFHKCFGMGGNDTMLAVTGISIDTGGVDFLLPLTTGARVVVAADEVLDKGALLLHLFEEIRPTVVYAKPGTWEMLLNTGWQGHKDLKCLCDREGLHNGLVQRIRSRCSSLWATYGSLETGIWSALGKVEPNEPFFIGEPVENTSFHLLDQFQQPVPAGLPGELYVSGSSVASGYFGRPELTAQRFIWKRTEHGVPEVFFRTGDRVRYDSEGKIEFLGHTTLRSEVLGFQMGEGEVEMLLEKHPSVVRAVVIVPEDIDLSRKPIAYIEPAPGRVVTGAELQNFLRDTVPESMMPSTVAIMSVFPSMAESQISRSPSCQTRYSALCGDGPIRKKFERGIRKIWQELLNARWLGLYGDSFALRGNTPLVIQIYHWIRGALDRDCPASNIFQYRSVNRLIDHFTALRGTVGLSCGTARTESVMPVRLTPETKGKLAYDSAGKAS